MLSPILLFSVQFDSIASLPSIALIAERLDSQELKLLSQYFDSSELEQQGFLEHTLSPLESKALHDIIKSKSDKLFEMAQTKNSGLKLTVVAKTSKSLNQEFYVTRRTDLVFSLFNDGALRGNDSVARQILMDSFSLLPNRLLSCAGNFLAEDSQDIGGIDKFPSLLSVRAKQLLVDGNRIVPGAMIRNGVHVGKGNIFMFHAAVNLAAFIGDDNLIDSHASIGSAAQIGNKNKIGSFVSLEGVLSPANAQGVSIGDENFLGSFVRIGTGISIGTKNFIGSGVNISLGTKLRDCRENSKSRGEYITPRDLLGSFNELAIMPNNAVRDLNSVQVLPGEYILLANGPDFMSRFEGDSRILAKK